jgi:hypothetical protein
MIPTRTEAERDAQEAEFLLGNTLFHRVLAEMEHDATEMAMNATAGGMPAKAHDAMIEACAVRELKRRLNELLRTKAGHKPVV